MRAAWYEKQGPPNESLVVGEMPEPMPGPGELRIRIAVSGVNPGDVKKRQDTFGVGMPYPRVVPHSDGAGVVDKVGDGVGPRWIGKRVWCFGAQSYRPFGTAAELGGSIATYASNAPNATIPFWPLVFKNVRVFFLGSDDFPLDAKRAAAQDLSHTIRHGWVGLPVGARFALADIAEAHAFIEERKGPGHVVVAI
jgi:NADPH:quinone reductase-like Zn-dependent oxidoreductase